MHRINSGRVFAAALALSVSVLSATCVRAEDVPDAATRWAQLREAIFGKARPTNDAVVKIDAPPTALEAAIVPVTLTTSPDAQVSRLYFVIDENPSPLAAKFTFGPAADPHRISMRVRVDNFTNLHAVAETKDGALHETVRFLKASGGCSTVMGVSEQDALQGIGYMRLKRRGEAVPGKPLPMTLMIMHPNFNGMQMNDTTGKYTPARFIRSINITYNDKLVLRMESDLSISTNPVLDFALLPDAAKGNVEVTVEDSQNARWAQSFDASLEPTN